MTQSGHRASNEEINSASGVPLARTNLEAGLDLGGFCVIAGRLGAQLVGSR